MDKKPGTQIVGTQQILIPFFKWLFLPVILQRTSRRRSTPANDNPAHAIADDDRALFLHGRGEFRHESAKTSRYQAELRGIARHSARHECIASLVLDDSNTQDRSSVTVAIDDIVTGVFPRNLSTQYREWLKRWHLSGAVVKCKAVIVASPVSDKADYRLKLDIDVPFRMTVE
jgi:hypothetical protein